MLYTIFWITLSKIKLKSTTLNEAMGQILTLEVYVSIHFPGHIKCIKNEDLTNEKFKTSHPTLFSPKESHVLIYDFWCPYLCLFRSYIQALYKFFQKVLYSLPGINTVWFITYNYNIYQGRASCAGRDEGRTHFPKISQTSPPYTLQTYGEVGLDLVPPPPFIVRHCSDILYIHILPWTAGEKLVKDWKSGLMSEQIPVA